MSNFRKDYYSYEQSALHTEIKEVTEIEEKLKAIYKELSGSIDKEDIYRLDSLIGELARAYEMQGFAFAQNVAAGNCDHKEAEPENAAPQKKKRVKKTNAIGPKGIPVRYITSNGITETVTGWKNLLGCSLSTLCTHINRDQAHLDEWVARRLSAVRA